MSLPTIVTLLVLYIIGACLLGTRLHYVSKGYPVAIKRHESITMNRIFDAIEQNESSTSNIGFCIACGAEQDGIEPDGKNYECESCGEKQVFGAEELLISGEEE